MNIKTPAPAYPFIPCRKTTEIDCDSLDFDPYESVKKPDAMLQRRERRAMLDFLDARFADYRDSPDVFVEYDTNISWDPDDLTRHVSPDVYIAFNVDAKAIRNRLIYLTWEAGKPPDLVMEIATAGTASEDVDIKPGVYAAVAAPEYWMFDATGGRYYGFPLKGLKLVDGEYQDIELTTEPDGILKGCSEVLRLSVAWYDGFPRLYDHASGRYIERRKDTAARADASEARADALAAHLDITEMQLESEIKARAAAQAQLDSEQAENLRLRDLISRLQNP